MPQREKAEVSVVIPFYNTPVPYFVECLRSVARQKPFEVILVDDCSTDDALVEVAKNSGFTYLKTPYQSGFDGLPFNLGVEASCGEYVCRVDSDDVLLALPQSMTTDICFGHLNRVAPPVNLKLEALLLAPRAICNAMVARRELWLRYPMPVDNNVFADVLVTLRMLHNSHSFTVFPRVNYLYRDCENSIQTSKPDFYHRLRHVQTVARFCQLENIAPETAVSYMEMAMLNVRYGSNALRALEPSAPKGEKR